MKNNIVMKIPCKDLIIKSLLEACKAALNDLLENWLPKDYNTDDYSATCSAVSLLEKAISKAERKEVEK